MNWLKIKRFKNSVIIWWKFILFCWFSQFCKERRSSRIHLNLNNRLFQKVKSNAIISSLGHIFWRDVEILFKEEIWSVRLSKKTVVESSTNNVFTTLPMIFFPKEQSSTRAKWKWLSENSSNYSWSWPRINLSSSVVPRENCFVDRNSESWWITLLRNSIKICSLLLMK